MPTSLVLLNTKHYKLGLAFSFTNISALIQHTPNFSPLLFYTRQLMDKILKTEIILFRTKPQHS